VERIEYEFAAKTLYYRRTSGGQTTTEVLLGGSDEVKVQAFAASYVTGQDWQGYTCTKTVKVRLELTVDNRTFTMTASASPRRNQLY
jgi:hypothetical protein